ncbi:MAG: DinB family protein [Candidatus Eisenbacteria bacterium]|nr:DinB family protein [Candidatus Eisenbacteria bacterium]
MNDTPGERELNQFFKRWHQETKRSLALMRTLPHDRYDFRPDPGGRSLGELAWHIAEVDGFFSTSLVAGAFRPGVPIPGLERPATIEAIAPGYERVHADAVARLEPHLRPEHLDRDTPFIGGRMLKLRDILWVAMLHHHIHHRGQLSLMNRLAGGVTPEIYGFTREQVAARRAAQAPPAPDTPPR